MRTRVQAAEKALRAAAAQTSPPTAEPHVHGGVLADGTLDRTFDRTLDGTFDRTFDRTSDLAEGPRVRDGALSQVVRALEGNLGLADRLLERMERKLRSAPASTQAGHNYIDHKAIAI